MTGDGTRALVWDAANRLGRVSIGAAVTSFAYGADGGEEWSAQRTKSQRFGFSNDERPEP